MSQTVPFDKLSSSIEADLAKWRSIPWPESRPIYRLPAVLRGLDVKAYEPIVVSIGPYHCRKEVLKEMESKKWLCLGTILVTNPTRRVENYVSEIRSLEQRLRRSYSDLRQINQMESDEFVKMILLDSMFLLFFLGALQETSATTSSNRTAPCREDDVLPDPCWLNSLIVHDIFLLENQLPFFVLEKIQELAVPTQSKTLRLIAKDTVCKLFNSYTVADPDVQEFKPDHLLHLCYYLFCSAVRSGPESRRVIEPQLCNGRGSNIQHHTFEDNTNSTHQQIQMTNADAEHQHSTETNSDEPPVKLPNAIELWKSGIMFKAKEAKERKLLNINFSEGILEIPCLFVDDNTNSLFRNLIAYEQTFPVQHFTYYALFISNLISKPSDVELLSKKKIIENQLSSDVECCELLSKLTVKISMLPNIPANLKPVFKGVNSFAGSKLRRWEAWIRHKYNNPWLILSLMAATILLVCTILQAAYAVKSSSPPPSKH